MENWMIRQRVDLLSGAVLTVWPNALMLCGNNKAHTWCITVYDGQQAANLTGYTATAYFIRDDGVTVMIAGTIVGNVCSVVLSQACYAIPGELRAVMRLISAENVLTLSAVIFRISDGVSNAIIDPGAVIPNIDDLLAQIDGMKIATSGANEAIEDVNELLESAKERIPAALDLDQYAYAVVDDQHRLGMGIRKDGTFVISKADAYPIGENLLTDAEISGESLAYAVLDKNNALSELAVGTDGKFPGWVLERWKQRMNVPDAQQVDEQITRVKAEAEQASEAAAGVNERLEAASERIPSAIDTDDYSYAIVDEQGRLGMGIRKDGSFVIPKADAYPIGGSTIQEDADIQSGILYSVVDENNLCSELTIEGNGRFPDWVLSRWKERMNVPDPQQLGEQIGEAKAQAEQASELAAGVSKDLKAASERIPCAVDTDDYAYAIVDEQGTLGMGIRKDGSFVIPKADTYPVGRSTIQEDAGIQSGILYSVVDENNLCSELTIEGNGCFPDWVLCRWKERMKEQEPCKRIVCWGDSLTAGAGGNGTSYRSVLQNTLNARRYPYDVLNGGVGGEGAVAIAARQGAYTVVVNNITIPADVTSVKIGDETTRLALSTGGTVTLMRQGTAMINPCSIAGVPGTLSIVQDSSTSSTFTYYFTRLELGNEVSITRPTFVQFDGWNYDGDIAVIWIGTNDTASTAEQIIAEQARMVERLTHNKYMIIGLTSKAYHADVAEKNKTMMARWGRRFFDIRQYLLDYGLMDTGITPTATDTAAITAGEIPPSLLSDAVHFNAAGYGVIGNAIFRRLLEDRYVMA